MTLSIEAHLPRRHRLALRICLGVTGFFLGIHALYWLPAIRIPLSGGVGFAMFAELFFFAVMSFLAGLLVVAVWIPLAVGSLVSARVRGMVGQRIPAGAEAGPGAWRFAISPWLHTVTWIAIALGHMGLDIDPAVAAAGYSGLLLLLPETWQLLGRVRESLAGRFAWGVVVVVVVLFWLPGTTDWARNWVLLALGAFLLANHWLLSRWMVVRDRFLLSLYVLIGLQMVVSFWPLFSAPTGAKVVGAGMAYSFIECDDRLFVVLPRCSPEESDVESCRRLATIDEFAWNGMRFERQERHRFFSEDYAGRAEQLGCFEGVVNVGMDFTLHEDSPMWQNLFEFEAADPSRFRVNVLGDASGDGFAYDAKRGVAYYRSENAPLVRRDLATDEQDRTIGEAADLSSLTDLAFHRGRDSLLAMAFYGRVSEVDGETYAPKGSYPILNAWEFSVDEVKARVYLSGNWGFEVLDLGEGRVIARHRIGLGGRRPALDPCNHVIYVPSTAGGRLQAFDRLSLRPLGTVPLGSGMRYPYVSRNGEFLFAGSAIGHYFWNARELAQQLRGGEPPPAPPDPSCAANPIRSASPEPSAGSPSHDRLGP